MKILSIINVKAVFVLLMLLQASVYLAVGQQQHQTKVYFDVTEDAINNVLEAQDVPRSFSGTQNGITYGVAANVQIKLKQNRISARLVVSGKLSGGGVPTQDFVWIVNPGVTINSFNITAREVIGVLQSIPSLINSQSGPQFLKDIIINAYNGLDLTLYPKKLLNQSYSLIPTFLDIEITDIGFGWEIIDKAIRFNAVVHSTVEPAVFGMSARRQRGVLGAKFTSTVETQINELYIYDQAGSNVWSNTNLSNATNFHIPPTYPTGYGGTTQEIFFANVAAGIYHFRVLFASPFGWYEVEMSRFVP